MFLRRLSGGLAPKILIVVSAAFIGLAASVAAAEELRVFPGQYVVELENVAHGDPDAIDAALEQETGLAVTRRLQGGARLLGSLGTFSAGSTVAYDPSDSFCVDALKAGLVSSCSPNFEMRIGATPNDPNFGNLWGMNTISAPAAWNETTGSNSVVIAVIDTGIDYNHPDLAANVWTNPAEIAGNGIDDDGNGVIDDVHGLNAINGSGDPMDDNGHGTHCAGTIGGVGNNGVGVAGVSWRVKMMGLKFLSATGSGSLAGAVDAINYMVMMKGRGVNIKVSSNSWGGGGFSQALENAISAANNAGILFIAAAGNSAEDNDGGPHYPGNYDVPNVVAVAAIDQGGNLASFSNYGYETVDIAAPGVGIYSTYPGNSYRSLSGTSMATPHVSGALGLLFAVEPSISVGEARQRLIESGSPSAALAGVVGVDGRVLNARRLVVNERTPIAGNPVPECEGDVAEVAFAPDSSADGAAVLVAGDENTFQAVELPGWSFPFHRESFSRVWISPNGVLYFKEPSAMDYRNGTMAPTWSVAPLHTDWIADEAGYGARVFAGANRFTASWQVKHYNQRAAIGEFTVTLFPNGTIETHLDVSPPAYSAYVTERSTVGVTGPRSASAVTFSSNAAFATPKGLRYTQSCPDLPDAPTSIDGLNLQTRNAKGQIVRSRAIRGRNLRIKARGTGEGMLNLQFGFNRSTTCAGTAEIEMKDGSASYQARVPRSISRKLRTLDVTVSSGTSGRTKSARFVKGDSASSIRALRVQARTIGTARLERYCSGLMLSLASRKKR